MAQLELKIGDKTYNKAWVDNVSSTSQISSDAGSVNYGVIPSTGNATMRDINGQIRADIESGVLPVSNAPTKVVINGNQIQEHITSDSDYDVINRELNLQFSDRLSLLDKVTYEGMPLRDYSMTAYEMLDDVIGSYGDYCKEKPVNWVKYQHGDAITTASGVNSIVVDTASGWEIIGTPLKVTPKKQYVIDYSISVGTAYTVSKGSGIPIQILRSEPTDTDCSSLEIASAFLGTTVGENTGTITFTPTASDTLYLVINFGYASENQKNLIVSINSITVNGNSLATAVDNSKCLGFISGIGMVGSNLGNKLSAITIPYPYLPSASFRETIEKFCTLAQMTLSLNEGGKILFVDARPLFKDSEANTIVQVGNKYKISNLNKTLFLKNKVDGVDIKQSKPTSTVEFNVVCLSENITSFPDYTTNQNNDYKTATASDGRGVSFKTYYTTFGVKIPKKTDNGLKDIQRVLSGVDNKGNSFIQYTVTWHYQQLVKYSGGEEIVDVGNTETGDIASAIFYSTTGEKISDAMSCTLEYGATASVSCTDKSNIFTPYIFKETKDSNGADFWEATITILVGKEAKHSFAGSTTSVDNEYIGGRFTPLSVDISFYGDVYTVSFEEKDLSTPNIKSANNAVSIPTNELMQNASDVKAIRDNILEDYNSGVPTATIDLFCGLKDWENGEIIQPNDVLTIEGEDGYWRVTGRTFKYAGAPTLSLELQKQTAIWRYICGGISSGTISTGDFTTNGTKTGAIKLPTHDYLKFPSRFTVEVVFNENGKAFSTEKRSSPDSNWVDVYTYNILGIHTCHCVITANWATGTISYTADEKYDVRAGVARKTYVEKIIIKSVEQFY